MKSLFWKPAALVLLGCSPAAAQVTISNPQHLQVPEDKVQILFRTACQVVAEEFHVHRSALEFPLTLVLGDSKERFTEDEEHQAYTIYLHHWDEARFAVSALRLANLRLVPPSLRNRMALEILKRSNQIAPVPVSGFAKKHG
jgi:hypothetical protein